VEDKHLNLATLSRIFADEDAARNFLEAKRWPDGPVCPHCSSEAYALTPKPGSKSPVRSGVYKCKACRKQFSVRIGTIFEESKIPIRKWLMAIHLMTSSKKGVSSHQIAREVGVTVKSAWFLTHRIREAMKLEPMAGMLAGVVESDETYVGGKPRYKAGAKNKRGSGTKKTPVHILVERGGDVRVKPMEKVDSWALRKELVVNVAKDAILMTDELAGYKGPGKQFAAHETVTHSKKEYARKRKDGLSVNVNTAESFFALLKRGHYGTFHHLSKKHLHRYCNEFGFRWNNRKTTDGERMVAALKGTEGKRLMYRDPKKNSLGA
jgi:transposase-like protein